MMTSSSDVTPVPEPRSDERPAQEHLAARGLTSEWERRAEWLEIEAKAQRDPAARARLLLAASEVRALLGARADARRLALQAAHHPSAPPLAARQARALHHAHGDVSALARSLAEEARASDKPELVAHALYVAAEVQRLFQRDPASARASLDAAAAADPGDGRVPLARLLLELSRDQAPPAAPLPAPSDAELGLAVDGIRRLRGELGVATEPELAGAVSLVDVQHALLRADTGAAARALGPLATAPGLTAAVRWLEAAWRAAAAERPDDALTAFRQLAREQPSPASRRALAAHALRAGRWDVLEEALAEPEPARDLAESNESGARPTRPAFSSIERAALAALLRRAPEPTASFDSAEAPMVGSIASAVERASSAPPSALASAASSDAEAEFGLGREAAGLTQLADAIVEGSALPWTLALRLERSRALGDWSSVARELPRLLEAPSAAAESSFVAAVLAERTGDAATARELYQASLPSAATREAATRALTERGGDGAALFRALSAHTSDAQRRGLLLTEALFRLDPGAPEFDSLAEDAARMNPELPLAIELGEAAARARGDRPRAARWLARRRELAQGADDYTLAALREALSVGVVDRSVVAERWRELLARNPDDLALNLAGERWLDAPARSRAEFRRRIAGLLGPRGRQRLLGEAVSLYQADGDRSAALAAARELGGPLAELWAARLASTDAERDAVALEWIRAAQRASSPAIAADLYDRLAWFERRRGRPERALAWQRERLAHEPTSLEALRALDIDNMAPGREAELERTAMALFEELGEEEGAGHAFVATRLKIARGAFQEALPLVRRMHASAVPPLWALRLAAVYARDAGDDRALIAICRSLRERSSQALDAATLSLHAAEAALRLGEGELAKEEIERASELAPDDIVILSARAEVSRESAHYAEAAEAYETLASATSSKRRQVDALYQAAVLWLDRLNHRARGMLALQEAASLDVPHPGLLDRLISLRAQSHDLDGLTELIESQEARAAEARAAEPELAAPNEGAASGEPAIQPDVALERWVAQHTEREEWAEAAVHQRELLERARDEGERRRRLLHLVQLVDLLPTGASEAESLLELARRTWPDDPDVLQAEVDHYVSLGHPGTARLVAERAMQTARSAIAAGRIEALPFRALEAAARLAADPDTSLAARAMAAAIAGGPRVEVAGAGARAADPELDTLLAPALVLPELRRILYSAGSAIERAYAVDPSSLGASAAPADRGAPIQELALGLGLDPIRVLRSADLGVEAIALGSEPVSLVLGDALLAYPDPQVQSFLVLRALKLARANASALSRLGARDAWAALAGLFACFGPLAPAEGQDAQLLLAARNRIRPHVTWIPEPDVSVRVSALLEEVLPHADRITDALCRWGTRAALLGVGDPAIALEGLSGQPLHSLRDEAARIRAIAGQSAARDVVSFGVSQAYIEARQRAGLSTAPR
jgi:hypothetical protein